MKCCFVSAETIWTAVTWVWVNTTHSSKTKSSWTVSTHTHLCVYVSQWADFNLCVCVCVCRSGLRIWQRSLGAGGRSERLVCVHTLVRQRGRRGWVPAGGMLGESGHQRPHQTSRYVTRLTRLCASVSVSDVCLSVCQMSGRVRREQQTSVWRWRRCPNPRTEQRIMGRKTCCCCCPVYQTPAHCCTKVWTSERTKYSLVNYNYKYTDTYNYNYTDNCNDNNYNHDNISIQITIVVTKIMIT